MIGVRHVGLIVNDIDKSLKLYNDVLGFTPMVDQIEKGNFYEHITGIKHGVARTCKCYSQNGTCIELIQYQTESLKKREKALVCEGFNHIALDVNDIDKIYKKLKNIGIIFINPPRYNDKKTAKVAFCKDFEGNYLELVQTKFK